MTKSKPTPDEIEPEIELKELTELGPAADPRKAASSREKQKLAEEQRKLDLVVVMSSPAGRRVMAEILRSSTIDELAFTLDAKQTAFNLGRQYTGEVLRSRMRRDCRELVRLMEDEEIDG
jgi:RNase P protein component